MARRKSFQQQLIQFAKHATEEQLDMALDTLKVFKSDFAPKTPKPRAKRSDAGKSRSTRTRTSSTDATDAAEASSSEN